MADRKPTPPRLPDAVREAVERTLEATRESAQTTRSRAQEAVEQLKREVHDDPAASNQRIRAARERAARERAERVSSPPTRRGEYSTDVD